MYTNAGLNKVILVGHITREPRWHTGEKCRQLSFTIRTEETIRSQQGDVVHEEFHNVRIEEHNPSLKRINLKKNELVYIQGKLHTNAYVDELQIKRYKTTVIATNVELFAGVPVLAEQ
jgi:single-strand DNA-binding protein